MGGGSSTHYVTEYVYTESEESKRIREQKALEEKNRQKADEELAPKLLGIVHDFYSSKLNLLLKITQGLFGSIGIPSCLTFSQPPEPKFK